MIPPREKLRKFWSSGDAEPRSEEMSKGDIEHSSVRQSAQEPSADASTPSSGGADSVPASNERTKGS